MVEFNPNRIFDEMVAELGNPAIYDAIIDTPYDDESWFPLPLKEAVRIISKSENPTGVLYDVSYLDTLLSGVNAPIEENVNEGEVQPGTAVDAG